MTIAARSTSSVNAVGTANRFATPLVIAAPAGLAVGDYLVVAVCFGSLPASSQGATPAGFTKLMTTATAGQDLIVFGKAIVTSGDLVSTVSLAAGSSTVTRAVAVAVALTGVASVASGTTIGFSNPLGGSAAFTGVTADAVLNIIYTGNSSGTGHPVHSSTGGTKLIQDIAVTTSTDPSTDNTLSMMLGGTGASFSPNATFGGWTSLGLTAAVVPITTTVGTTVWNGTAEIPVLVSDWDGSAARPVTKELVSNATGVTAYNVYDRFSRYKDGATPDVTDTGQPWGLYSGPAVVTGGFFDSVEGTGASYLEAVAGRAITLMGAKWKYDNHAGALTGTSPTMTIVSWADGGYAVNGPGRRTRCHLVITPTGASYYVRDAVSVASDSLVNIANWTFPALAMNVIHTAEVSFSGTTATLVIDGTITRTVTEPRIASNPGETFPCWEPYYGADGTDPRVRFSEVWANLVAP